MLSQEPRRRVTVGSRAVQEALDGTHQRQRFPNSWNVTFTLITARDDGVPPYSMNRHRLVGDAAHLVPDRLAVVSVVSTSTTPACVRRKQSSAFSALLDALSDAAQCTLRSAASRTCGSFRSSSVPRPGPSCARLPSR